jgi:large subunit ribosomal protein L7/L12
MNNIKEKFETIINNLTTLSLCELNLLIIELEKKFNLTYSINSNINTATSENLNNINNEIKEEKSTYNLILQTIQSDKKISVLKIVRTITGLGLKESKDIVENLPKILKENISKDEYDKLKNDIEIAGGSVNFE